MATDDILREAVARLADAFPTGRDASGDPFAAPKAKLPAWRVGLILGPAERLSMADARHWRDATLTVAVWTEVERDALPTGGAGEGVGHAVIESVRAAIMGAPADLGGAVWTIAAGEGEADHDAGDRRITRTDITFPLRFIEAAA